MKENNNFAKVTFIPLFSYTFTDEWTGQHIRDVAHLHTGKSERSKNMRNMSFGANVHNDRKTKLKQNAIKNG